MFTVNTGVRQGCVLSLLLFNIYIDRITKETTCQPTTPDVNVTTNETDESHTATELLFADDQCLFYRDVDSLQEHLNRLSTTCTKYNMKINTSKTETMQVSRSPGPLDIKLHGTPLKQVNEFKYLGSMFTEDGRLDREIEIRCQKANALIYQLSPLLKHQNIPMTAKQQIINSIFIPTLCYQSQTWTMTKAHIRKINTCEMRCLRRAANLTIRDRVKNEHIRQLVGTTPCSKYIQRQKIKWFGHVVRMEDQQLPAQAFYQRRSAVRARGRPRRRWIDDISEIVKKHKMTLTSATHLALDRRLFLPTTLHGKSGT